MPDIKVVRGVPAKARNRFMGDVPSPVHPAVRLPRPDRLLEGQEICADQDPPLERKAPDQIAACHFAPPPAESIVAEAV